MIWRNPWAWLGVAALAAPVLIHLLTRRHAVRVPFPTLRFLPAGHLSAVRFRRLSDLALLAIRITIVAAAVAALAQPLLITSGRRRALDATLTRAVVVDISQSLERKTPDGRRALDVARERAAALAPPATVTRVIEAAQLPVAVASAAAWLGPQPGHHEIVLVSDFQTGAIDRVDLAAVPVDAGVRLVRVDIAADPVGVINALPVRLGDRHASPRLSLDETRTRVAWETRPVQDQPATTLVIFNPPADQQQIAAALSAAVSAGVPAPSAARPIDIVFGAAANRSAVIAAAKPLDQPWMFDVVRRLHEDASIATLVRQMPPATASGDGSAGFVAGHDVLGKQLVRAGSSAASGTPRLLLVCDASGRLVDIFRAAFLSAVMRAASDSPPSSELEPRVLSDAVLRSWERLPAAASAESLDTDDSDGRWLWVLALVLLAAESWLRRNERVRPTLEVARERVA